MQSGYATLAVLVVPSAQHGDKIRSVYLTPAFWEPTYGQGGNITRARPPTPSAATKSELAAQTLPPGGSHVGKVAE